MLAHLKYSKKTLGKILVECDGVINFIDDILVYGEDKEEHDSRLKKVMEVLEQNNVLLHKDKCVYGLTKVQFLGHELSKHGVRPLDKYICAVEEFREPTTVAELQSFLGLINFVGKWIPHLATLSEPLKMLLRKRLGKNTVITENWREAQRNAFADASPVGLGAVLVQFDAKGPGIIAFGKKKLLSDCKRRYSQTEKVALALVWACEHFDMFLYGKEFDLITVHKPLEIIFGQKTKSCARIERWVLRLQLYKYKSIIYRPGKENVADPLSRLCKLAINPMTIYKIMFIML